MSAIESFEQYPSEVVGVEFREPYQSYVDLVPIVQFPDRELSYGVLCVAMQDSESGDVLIVRKSHEEDSARSRDWLVVTYNPDTNQLREEVVIQARTNSDEFGDIIELDIAPTISHHGPHTLTFHVDTQYSCDSNAQVTHKKYYGRGYGKEAETYVDATYNQQLFIQSELSPEHIAPVIPIEQAKETRRQRLGHSAIVGA